jgi:hypothetical protein
MAQPRRGGQPSQQSAQTYRVRVPIGGLNTVASALDMPDTDCPLVVNLLAAENGLRTRLGYREWSKGLLGDSTNEVRSLLPFTGSQESSSRVFGVLDNGIYDVSAGGTSSPRVATFRVTNGNSGFGMSTVMVTAGGHFLVYCDELNGTWLYSENGGTWTRVVMGTGPQQISGVDPDNLVFPFVFKNRLWFVERDSANAWYLPLNQIYGVAQKFPLGALFRAGGHLIGLWSWTYDGGAGLDDSLVAVSSGGDVLVYQGTDPSQAATFGLKGVWSIGPPPAGRRIGNSTGGELLLLSRLGLVPMSKLVLGAITSAEFATAKVSNYLNDIMREKAVYPGWAVIQQPEDATLLVLIPRGYSSTDTQLAQALASPLRPWFPYTGVPMLSAANWEAHLYFGTADGRVCVHTGTADNVLLTGTTLVPISWSFVSDFSDLGTPTQKQVQLIRPLVVSDMRIPAIGVAARYDYDKTVALPSVTTYSTTGTWGYARWGVDKWGGAVPFSRAGVGVGMGVNAAVAVSGRSTGKVLVLGVDVTFTTGGFL